MTDISPFPIDVRKIRSLRAVVNELRLLNEQLPAAGLTQFALFNNAYYIVTTSVQHTIEDKPFGNSTFIEAFIAAFAAEYFKAVNDAACRTESSSVAWSKVNEYATNQRAPKFIGLMLGANAHINGDLPRVLHDLGLPRDTHNFLGDIALIDKILMQSGRKIITSFEEQNPVLDFLKRHLQFMYYRPAMYTVRYWRIIAWRNHKRLNENASCLRNINSRSVRIANHWIILSKVLSA